MYLSNLLLLLLVGYCQCTCQQDNRIEIDVRRYLADPPNMERVGRQISLHSRVTSLHGCSFVIEGFPLSGVTVWSTVSSQVIIPQLAWPV